MSSPATPGPIPISNEAAEAAKKEKPKPTKTLPTDRLNVTRQLDILRAYAAASANGTRPATVGEVAEIVKMSAATIQLAHPFLASLNLITRTGTGAYTVSAEALSFLNAYEWDKETASHKLGPVMRNTWFGQALLSRITFGPIDEKNAIAVLAEACSAPPEYEKELRSVIEFMAASGLVLRENGQVRPRPTMTAPAEPVQAQPRIEEPREKEPSVKASRLNTSVESTPGKFNLNISVEVDMAEFSTWRPERIQAFFRGVAEVLAAKADVEKGGTGS
jgi:hypothetical protein